MSKKIIRVSDAEFRAIAEQHGFVVNEPQVEDDFTKHESVCGGCGRVYHWSADDIAWQYEESPFMPCGCPWDVLDKAL